MTTSSVDESGVIHRALRDIVHGHGPDALDDSDLTAAMLKELLPQHPREVAAVHAAASEQVAGRLWTRVETTQVYTAVAEIAYELATSAAIDMEVALWVVTAYAIVLGLQAPADEAADAAPPPGQSSPEQSSQSSPPPAPSWPSAPSAPQMPTIGRAPGGPPPMQPGAAPGAPPSTIESADGSAPRPVGPGASPSAPSASAPKAPMPSMPAPKAPMPSMPAPKVPVPSAPYPSAQQPAAPAGSAPPRDAPSGRATTKAPAESERRRGAKSAVERAVARSLQKGLLTFTTPDSMRQGRKERVEVGIARSTDLESELDGLFRTSAPRTTEVVETAEYMTVEVIGDAFTIVPLSRANQLVVPLARWEFDVTPKQAGDHTLTIIGTCWVTVGTDQREISLPSFERQVRVNIDVVFGFRRALSTNWQWIVGTVAGLGAAIAGWVALFK